MLLSTRPQSEPRPHPQRRAVALLSLTAQACSHVIYVPLIMDGVHRSGECTVHHHPLL